MLLYCQVADHILLLLIAIGAQEKRNVTYATVLSDCWFETYANFDAGVAEVPWWLLGTVMCFWTGFSYVV